MKSDETQTPPLAETAVAGNPPTEAQSATATNETVSLQGAEGLVGRSEASCESQRLSDDAGRRFVCYAWILLGVIVIASAVRWSWYPVFVDTYYHMAAIHGFQQAGGLPTWAFWEMAPAGRVHIYPPAIHVVGYLFTFAGVTPEGFITFLSWLLYPALLITTWIWMHSVFGPRPALAAVILLCGPGALFWNQTSFNANAFALTLAPLALLALEKERFLTCAVLNLLAATAHPMGLFLPPALVINTLLRRKKLWAGLLSASLPMVLYLPWLGHIWANRAFLPEERTGGDISLGGIGAGFGLNLGVALGLAALAGVVWIVVRRREALGLVGPALGFAVVFAMGFGGRFLQFNVHWPLACIGGFGVAMLLDTLGRGAPWRQAFARVASVSLAVVALSTWAAFEIPMPKQRFGGMWRRDRDPVPPPAPPPAAQDSTTNRDRPEDPPRAPFPGAVAGAWSFSAGPSAVARLLSTDSTPGTFNSLGRGGGGRGGGPGGFGNRGGRRGGPFDPGGFGPPGAGFARGGLPGGRGGPGGGPGGMDMIHQEGAREFFEATKKFVKPGEIIFLQNPMAASLLTGVTGRWTSGGILRDVRSEGRATPEECEFFAVIGGGFPGGGPGGFGGPFGGGNSREPSDSFEKLFENSFGSLWKNPSATSQRQPARAAVGLLGLAVLSVIGAGIALLDLLLRPERKAPRIAAGVTAFAIALLCIAPLAKVTAEELQQTSNSVSASNDFSSESSIAASDASREESRAVRDEANSDVPERLRTRYDKLQRALSELNGRAAREAIWSTENRLEFRRLLDTGKLDEAEAMLDRALRETGSR